MGRDNDRKGWMIGHYLWSNPGATAARSNRESQAKIKASVSLNQTDPEPSSN
jgi:hypothetical protein